MGEKRSTPRLWAAAVMPTGSLLLITGCSVLGGDPVQEQWQDRSTLPSCGEFTLELDERLETSDRPETACMKSAWVGGAGAELVVRYSTKEGDPVTEYYRVTPGSGTEVFIDATQDKFGSQRWEVSRCPTPASAFDVNC